MRRVALAVALAAALLLAGCSGEFGANATAPNGSVGPPGAPANATPGSAMAAEPRPDPETDTLGWEEGYWYNDPLSVADTTNLTAEGRAAVVARATARVERLRGQEFDADVSVRVVSRSEAGLGGGGAGGAARQRFDNAKFEAAFLVGERDDSGTVQGEGRNRTVGGYYSPGAEAIVVVSDAARPTLRGEGVLAHELVHALQDQRGDLAVRGAAETRDGVNAVLGLVEGEAQLLQQEYGDRCGAVWSCVGPAGSGGDGGGGGDGDGEATTPPNWGTYFLSFFPYSDGPDLVRSLRDGDDWSAVDAAYDDPPETAQAVIDPASYGSSGVERVALADRSGPAWERVRPSGRPDYGRLGRSGLAAMLARTAYDDYNRSAVVTKRTFVNLADGEVNRSDPLNYDLRATRGWTGDRLHVYRSGERTGYVWRLRWASAADARRFAGAYREVLAHWGGERVGGDVWVVDEGPFADAFRVTVEGSRVTVTNAPTRAALSEVYAR